MFLDLPFKNKKDAFDQYVSKGWAPQSFILDLIEKEDGKYAKEPKYLSLKWKTTEAYYNSCCNAMQLKTGSKYNLVVLDIDNGKPGMEIFNQWCTGHGGIETYTVKTQGGGFHYYFTFDGIPEIFHTNKQHVGGHEGIDWRADGGIIYAPPTTMEHDGYTYTYEIFKNIAPSKIPEWLLDLLISSIERVSKPISKPKMKNANTSQPSVASQESDADCINFTLIGSAQKYLQVLRNASPTTYVIWNNHQDIIKLIFACTSLSQKPPLLYNDVVELCKLSEKAQPNLKEWVKGVWTSFDKSRWKGDGLTVLKSMALKCNATSELNEIIRSIHIEKNIPFNDSMIQSLENAINRYSEHRDLASYCFQRLHKRYRYGYDQNQKQWRFFAYTGSIWIEAGSIEMLRSDIDNRIYKTIEAIGVKWRNECDDSEKTKNAELLRVNMSKNGFFESLWSKCESYWKSTQMYIDLDLPTPVQFFKSLDDNPYLIGFNNGVYHVKNDVFYKKNEVPPEFNVSMTVDYNYIDPESDENAIEIMETIENVVYKRTFPIEETRNQIKMFAGSLLISGNQSKKLVLMLGEKGDNAKSSYIEYFLAQTLGQYAAQIPIQILTELKTSADSCNPTLAINRKRKVLYLHEGDKKAKLNAGTTKTLTGNDNVCVRNLYGQPESVKFHPKICYISNHAPIIDASDQALSRRMYPIDFVSSFSHDVEEDDYENLVFKAMNETECREKFHEWRPYHMLLLMKWCREHIKLNFVLPKPPSSSTGVQAIENASHQGRFKEWLETQYERTDPNDPKIWTTGVHPVTHVSDILNLYNSCVKDKIDLDDCKKLLNHCGLELKKVSNKYIAKRNMVYLRKVI